MAVLGKVLFEEAPPVHERCPGVPPALDILVAQMLAKDPAQRPRDGREAAAALTSILESLESEEGRSATTTERVYSPVPMVDERRAVSLVLVGAKPAGELAEAFAPPGPGEAPSNSALREAVEARGGRVEILADGSAVVVAKGSRLATDQAVFAARCALRIRAVVEDRAIVVVTGYGHGEVRSRGRVYPAAPRARGSDRRARPADARVGS